MFAIKFSIEKRIKIFWVAGFFLPAINTTVFTHLSFRQIDLKYVTVKVLSEKKLNTAAIVNTI